MILDIRMPETHPMIRQQCPPFDIAWYIDNPAYHSLLFQKYFPSLWAEICVRKPFYVKLGKEMYITTLGQGSASYRIDCGKFWNCNLRGLYLFFPKLLVGLCSPEAEILDVRALRRPIGALSPHKWETVRACRKFNTKQLIFTTTKNRNSLMAELDKHSNSTYKRKEKAKQNQDVSPWSEKWRETEGFGARKKKCGFGEWAWISIAKVLTVSVSQISWVSRSLSLQIPPCTLMRTENFMEHKNKK